MTYTTLSTKYQVVIPKEIRLQIKIKPGQKFIVWTKDGLIYLIPEVKTKALEGMFQGLNTKNLRDEGERL